MSVTPLNEFIRASDALVTFGAMFNDLGEEIHNVYTLEIQGEEIRRLWEEVRTSYTACLKFFETSASSKSSDVDVAASKYQTTYMAYFQCLGSINQKMDKFKRDSKNSNSSAVNLNCGNSEHNLTLPPCDVDTFGGDYVSWPTFRDLFTAIYINSSRLSNIERLCHLIRKTEGEAKDIVTKYPLINESFDLAWRDLKETYENTRMLVHNQLKLLFGLPSFDKESITALKTLQRGINSCLTALSIYKIPTENWDPIIIFICIQRLPRSTVILWEQGVKDKSVLSTWHDFDNFLTERIQTLQCLHDLKETNSTDVESSVHSYDATSSKPSCILCPNQSHFLRNCRKFKNLSIMERISTVNKYNCCSNCLSRTHNVSNCKVNSNCFICNNRHHSMLHIQHTEMPSVSTEQNSGAVLRTTNSPQNNQPSTTSNNITSNRQVFHTRYNQFVLLGTATVNIKHNNNKYQVRALIDPGSECSFITERLRKRFNISSRSTNVEISGVNNTASVVSRNICSLKIGSNFDSSVELNINAFVLPEISTNLPTTSVNANIQKLLPNLRLADFNPFDSRPIDILIGADLYPWIVLPDIQRNLLGSLLAQKTIFGWILTGPVNPNQFNSVFNFPEYSTWSHRN
ncbi:uncharacterized protein LOC119600209 [Lucilia sericata]|uniref:uncharacterized protein LOC119600209 n=1 Tax=Lucilia sericata TaxID=13632 RepID=UPI0018A824BF|nr:uncharacterized protein LOC119600209 [Lucilia sericata]XP_037806235.1 uncharacterized protein LOC119600209 [Lucilia sericata]